MAYRTPLETRIAKKTTKAIVDYRLIEDGDRVMVGLSGGKDSWALIQILDVLRHPHKVHVGSNVVIDDHCLIDAKGESNRGIRIGDGVFVGRNTILSCKNGDIELGDATNIGFNCELFSASRVTIGRSVLMAAYGYVIGGDHDFSDPAKAVLAQSRTSTGVVIGDGVWMGAGAKVLDGVEIGPLAVIGAAAVVRENVPASAIAVGIPARVVSTRG